MKQIGTAPFGCLLIVGCQEIRFQKIDLEGKNNILRVTLNDNRRLRKELNQKNQLLKKYQEVLMKYQEEGKL